MPKMELRDFQHANKELQFIRQLLKSGLGANAKTKADNLRGWLLPRGFDLVFENEDYLMKKKKD